MTRFDKNCYFPFLAINGLPMLDSQNRQELNDIQLISFDPEQADYYLEQTRYDPEETSFAPEQASLAPGNTSSSTDPSSYNSDPITEKPKLGTSGSMSSDPLTAEKAVYGYLM
jgi:hypothetical protein